MAEEQEDKPMYAEWEAMHYKKLEKKHQLTVKYFNEAIKNTKFREYLKPYREDTQNVFLKEYADFKAEYELSADKYFKQKQIKELQFHKTAEEMLWYIQQKKLFDLQCLWRAEQIQIKEIKICDDFAYWSADIKRCPFIDPITEQEAELLQQFVSSLSFEKPLFNNYNWQNYEDFAEEHKGDQEMLSMPEWYHFYNMHRGTEALMILPDIRGKKEEHYQQVAINYRLTVSPHKRTAEPESEKEEDAALHINENEEYDQDDPAPFQFEKIIAPDDKRPFLGRGINNEINDFINQFEDEKLKSIHQLRQRLNNRERKGEPFDNYRLQQAMQLLIDAGDNYPIDAYYDWRQAVLNLANKFERENIAKEIPIAYQQYKFRIESGIAPFLTRVEKNDILKKKKENKFDRELILEGRKLLNEPLDFNY